MSFTLDELARISGARLEGDPDCNISAVNTLKHAKEGDISFLSNRHYAHYLLSTRASAVILSEQDAIDCPTNSLITDNPYLAYAKIVNFLYPEKTSNGQIHESAVIGQNSDISAGVTILANAVIGENVKIKTNCYIGPGSVLEDNVIVGENTRLIANVTLCHDVIVGSDVLLHPGVVIGSDGFGLAQDKGKWLKIPQIGSVLIGNEVEIGANTTIDRGAIEDTIIESGVKIDNQVQIGHNVVIGENTAIAGCTGIAGSTSVGKRCMIGGGVGISGHIEIADDVVITAMSGVANSIKTAGVYSSGVPITDNKVWRRNIIRFKQLDETIKKILKKLD